MRKIFSFSPYQKIHDRAFIFVRLLTFNLFQLRTLERAMLTFRNEICQETLSKVYTLAVLRSLPRALSRFR